LHFQRGTELELEPGLGRDLQVFFAAGRKALQRIIDGE
jgi:hypothetical protein